MNVANFDSPFVLFQKKSKSHSCAVRGREGLVLHQQVTPPKKRNEGHLAGACASNMPQQLQAMKQIAKITASFLHRGPPDTRSRLLEWSLAHGRLLWSTERLHRSLCQSVFWLDRHNSPFSPPSLLFSYSVPAVVFWLPTQVIGTFSLNS